MAASEQLLERPVQTAPRSEAPLTPPVLGYDQTTPRADADAAGSGSPQDQFSPDASRRTDRYRLVTPFLLRL